jgi:hypothetical protein
MNVGGRNHVRSAAFSGFDAAASARERERWFTAR